MINSIIPVISMMIGFYFGFKIGNVSDKPKFESPVKKIKENIENNKTEKKTKKDKKVLEQYIENIDNYPNNQQRIKE